MRTLLLAAGCVALAACAHDAGPMPETPRQEPSAEERAAESSLSPEQVRMVQRSLAERGFAVEPTGTFDDRTRMAVADFQRARSLPTTGTLNVPTVEALGLDPAQVTPVRGHDAHPAAPAPVPGQGSAPPPAPAPAQPRGDLP